MLTQTYFTPFGVKALAASTTAHGITSKMLLFGTHTDQARAAARPAPPALTALALARLVYSVWARTPTRRAHRRCRPASPPALAPLQGLSSVCV